MISCENCIYYFQDGDIFSWECLKENSFYYLCEDNDFIPDPNCKYCNGTGIENSTWYGKDICDCIPQEYDQEYYANKCKYYLEKENG